MANNQAHSPYYAWPLIEPLNQYEWSSSLRITNEIEDVFTRQVVEPNQEAKLNLSYLYWRRSLTKCLQKLEINTK